MKIRAPHIALLTVVCFLILFAYSLAQLINIDRGFRQEIDESNLWAATQADREAQNLMLMLYRVGPGQDVDGALLRFEILYSRIALMLDPPQIDYFRTIGVGGDVRDAKALLDKIDVDMSSSAFGSAQIPDVMPEVVALSDILHRITTATALENRVARHASRENQLRVMHLLLLAVGGVFMSGLVMAAMMWRNMRRAVLAHEELQLHREKLEETVAIRTQELQDALEVERRAKDVYRSFIVTVSHQFRTPVSIIHMIAQRQLRSDDTSLSDGLKRKFSRIFDAAERLERLLSGFLASASAEGKDITLSRRVMDLNVVATIAAEQIAEANRDRVLETRLPEQALRVDADPVLIEQVILNLLSNAMKYSDAPAVVTLETWREEGRIFCRVADHGAGIPEDAQATIFDRFYRAPNVHRLPGVGVGLSLVRDIVSLHGGEVSFTSRLGEGSEFTVALPALGDNENEPGSLRNHDFMYRG